MTDFDASEEPPSLPAAGRAHAAESAGVGVIDKHPAPAPQRLGVPAEAPSRPVSDDLGAALRGSAIGRSLITVLRYLDVALVLLAAPVALSLGAPALGYA